MKIVCFTVIDDIRILLVGSLLLLTVSVSAIAAEKHVLEAEYVDRMTVNGRTHPMGIAADDISFGWTLRAAERGTMQSAYRIRVSTTEGGDDVWDSGLVASDRQVDVQLPANCSLTPATCFYWQVKVGDGNGKESEWSEPAWFETGLLSALHRCPYFAAVLMPAMK